MTKLRVPQIDETALGGPEKPVERPMALARYMGGLGQPNAPQDSPESFGNNGVNTTKYGACSGSVLVSQSAFHHGVDRGGDNNGINSGHEVAMCKGQDNNVLHKIADGYCIEGRMVDGKEVALLIAISPLARQVVAQNGGKYLEITVLLELLPEGYSSPVVANLEAQGVQIACV